MKKYSYITLLLVSLIFISCDNGLSRSSRTDEIVSIVIKTEQSHLNNYNNIKRLSNDTVVNHYIDSLKKEYTKKVYETKGIVKSHVGFLNGDLEKSLKLIDTYIDSLKK